MIGQPTLILCYHRIAGGVSDPFRLCVTPDNFATQLAILQRHAEMITLDEVCQPSSKARVAVTFDDGYADNLLNAVPIAQRLGVPITVYITSRMIDDEHGFWWDRLAQLLFREHPRPIELSVEIGGTPVRRHLGNAESAREALTAIQPLLKVQMTDEIERVISELAQQIGASSSAPPDARPLTGSELQQLASSDGVTIGAHTTRHLLLRGRPLEVQHETIATSRIDLETTLGRSVSHFAYPFGGHDAFDEVSFDAVAKAGLTTATTTVPGSVGRAPNPFALNRRMVMDWGNARFRAQVLRWGMA